MQNDPTMFDLIWKAKLKAHEVRQVSDWKEDFGDEIAIGQAQGGKPWAYANSCFSDNELRRMVLTRIGQLQQRLYQLQKWHNDSQTAINRKW